MTAATAALDPEPMPGSGSVVAADDTVTVSWADFRAWERQLTTCAHPIRLRGRIEALDLATGELAPVYDTAADIDPLARGVGWLLSETGVPRRIKAAYLDDDTIKYLAAYAARLRHGTAA